MHVHAHVLAPFFFSTQKRCRATHSGSRHDQYKLLPPLHDLDIIIKLSTDPPLNAFVSLLNHIQLSRRLDVYYILRIASDTLPLFLSSPSRSTPVNSLIKCCTSSCTPPLYGYAFSLLLDSLLLDIPFITPLLPEAPSSSSTPTASSPASCPTPCSTT